MLALDASFKWDCSLHMRVKIYNVGRISSGLRDHLTGFPDRFRQNKFDLCTLAHPSFHTSYSGYQSVSKNRN